MIPKKIHYCWFGGNPLPDLAIKCIESWKKYCPEYEIIEWNESNFDINCCKYVKEAYEAKKWAFVSDVVRLYALVNYGGIYMDTDVEVLKSLDDILSYEAVSGFENEKSIPTGLMACEKNHPLFSELLHEYDNIHFLKKDGSLDLTTNVTRITNTCLKYGLKLNNSFQKINGLVLFPNDYFCPKDYLTGKINLTENTYTIHHFDGSWLSDEKKYSSKLRKSLCKIFSIKVANLISTFIGRIKYQGMKQAVIDTIKFCKKIKNKKGEM